MSRRRFAAGGTAALRAILLSVTLPLGLLWLALPATAAPADPVLVDGRDRVDLSDFMMLRDPGRSLAIGDLRGRTGADPFTPSPRLSQDYSLGITADALWLRTGIDVAPQSAGRRILTLDVPNFDRMEVWGSWSPAAEPIAVLGDHVPRSLPFRRNAAVVDLPAGHHTLWFRGVTSGSMAVPLDLWRPAALIRTEQVENLAHAALVTVVLLLGGCAVVLAAALPSLALAFYGVSAFATAGHILAMTGLDALLWGRHLPIGGGNPFVWLVISGVFGIGFLFAALPARRGARWVVPVLATPVLLGTALLVVYDLFLDGDFELDVVLRPRNLTLLILAAGLAASIQSWLAGYRAARFMIAGWAALAAGNVLTALRNAGVVPWTDATYFLPVYAPMVEMLFFGAMKAARLRLLRVEKDRAQRALVTALRRNEAELAERVALRTAALDRANAALQDREAQLRQTLEAVPLAIVLTDAVRSAPLYANRRARDQLGGSDLYHDPADRDRLLAMLERDGRVENAETGMLDGAGNRFWALVSMVPIEYQGQPARLLAVNDITGRKQLEQELTKEKEIADASVALERAAREAQRQFLAMISHEFRTPLAVISTAAQTMGLTATDEATGQRLLRIERSVRHMNGMIEACLLDDRIDGAGLMLRSSLFDPGALVCRIAEAAQAAAPQHRLCVAAEDLPDLAGDEQLLGIALSNLMENAVKYAPSDGMIEVALRREGDDAVFSVADRGPGIPEGERERIFEKYQRGAATGRIPGAGLGLHLTRHIVTAHGGTVGVRNRPGGGALFTIRLRLPDIGPSDADGAFA
ncbi:PAS domain S-box protein [Azospirillum sp. YIM B02556]|uniref:histidine kinase n=1 Tax=Azospirillum endophyticum TaxID=2800326 RepID=A0ABS1EYM2_9PROT|nr:ATP-binding protein [Azospirillum endophyticum]MBK1836233.1 PAS domain S-box protein [Azospirillum endophyticum]